MARRELSMWSSSRRSVTGESADKARLGTASSDSLGGAALRQPSDSAAQGTQLRWEKPPRVRSLGEQRLQKISPQLRQWCRRLKAVKGNLQPPHSFLSRSGTHLTVLPPAAVRTAAAKRAPTLSSRALCGVSSRPSSSSWPESPSRRSRPLASSGSAAAWPPFITLLNVSQLSTLSVVRGSGPPAPAAAVERRSRPASDLTRNPRSATSTRRS
mmetsp:Transcript_17481/g.38319  ORF Transcript_17481/g.38319 Transcript_17481/m.38319 type:complete len:213 (+) Transcript_17481:2861-3499(+)